MCETKAIVRRGRIPASVMARASSSVTATPVASSNAASEPAVVVAGDDRGSAALPPGQLADHVRGLGAAGQGRREDDAHALSGPGGQQCAVLLASTVTHGGPSACQIPSKVPSAPGAW